jgi:hypothetical protein
MPVEALAKRRFGTDDEKNERKIGSRTPTDAIRILPRRRAQPRPWIAKAHIYRRSTTVLASL